ncbi:MAG TPA: MarR family transcriptional regulator [Symbiobacteriaceae bacterium]|jgi:DNA-binding MarR family transcriptional regulator|nr:MarR family transcriptional regulator [Symbiobacteriaceae bacterium]
MDGAQVARSDEEVQAEGVLPLIQLISDLIEKRCDRFLSSRYGLTTPQFQLLLAATQSQDVTLGGLSEQLNCSRGNVTGIVDRLERDQWLQRERSTDDRRVITVRLTEKGDQVAEIQQHLATELATLSRVWDHGQRETLSEMLLRLYRELKE